MMKTAIVRYYSKKIDYTAFLEQNHNYFFICFGGYMAGVFNTKPTKVDLEEIGQALSDPSRALPSEAIKTISGLIENGCPIVLNKSINDRFVLDLIDPVSEFIKHFLSLRNLNLNFEAYSLISDSTIVELTQHCPRLKKINLKSCMLIGDAAVEAIAINCKELEEINLSWCNISKRSLFALAAHSKNLKKVEVRSCYVTDDAVEELVRECSKLSSLSLSWCKSITDRAVSAITEFCRGLVNIDLRGNEKISEISFISLIENTKNLKTIQLKRCPNVTDKVLLSIPYSSLFEKINLRGCYQNGNISNLAILSIAARCNQLSTIDLAWHHYLSDDSVVAIATNCPKLEAIDISGCYNISDDALVALLEHCKLLRKLILFNNPNISESVKSALRESGVNVIQY